VGEKPTHTRMNAPAAGYQTPRLLVLTDITSLSAGLREPDDGQSLIRLLLYSNQIAIEGLVASSNLGHGQVCRPELIQQAVAAYAQVRARLAEHDPVYPDPALLDGRIRAGQPLAGPAVPVETSIGPRQDTPASELILSLAERPDPRPLWVAVWGGTADLAQALWRARQERGPAELAALLANLRVHAIGDQDSTGDWIKHNFPGLYYITRRGGYRGMYRGGDTTLSSSAWVQAHARGHGALGELYPDYDGGDIWSASLGRVKGIKEGDTPSYLGLIPNGLNPRCDPAWGDWGGRCQPEEGAPNRLSDAVDTLPGWERDPLPSMATVYRWRAAFQADFQARLDWCVRSPAAANHAPLAHIAGPAEIQASPGQRLRLDARASRDPAGRALRFAWQVYHGPTSLPGFTLAGPLDQPQLELTLPRIDRRETLHLLLTVTNDGDPALSAYARVLVEVAP